MLHAYRSVYFQTYSFFVTYPPGLHAIETFAYYQSVKAIQKVTGSGEEGGGLR